MQFSPNYLITLTCHLAYESRCDERQKDRVQEYTLGHTTKQTRNTIDKDEVNKREIRECDGRAHDPDTMVAPLTPKPTRKTESLTKVSSTINKGYGSSNPTRMLHTIFSSVLSKLLHCYRAKFANPKINLGEFSELSPPFICKNFAS